ncbi:AMP-binding protein [Nocardia fluminea]|uniref:AMP-binding protein n=1 Tax=Nocardia fluminea TaxID=134984 RepID=UPI00366D3DF8
MARAPRRPSTEADFQVRDLSDHRGADTVKHNPIAAPSDLSFLMYTSGTTGPLKGCMVSPTICHQGSIKGQSTNYFYTTVQNPLE